MRITNTNGTVVVGDNNTVHGALPEARRGWLGVITVLPEETRAVIEMLRRSGSCADPAVAEDGTAYRTGRIGDVPVVLIRTLDQGQRSMAMAVENLRRLHDPAVIALVGIAGGLHRSLSLGDVVIANEVVYYDIRRESAGQTLRRGRTQPIPSRSRHAVNEFFTTHGSPAVLDLPGLDDESRTCTVFTGPIGSGEAVVADRGSPIRHYLQSYNDTTLAVETEAGALAQAAYERSGLDGWLTIRGISDLADADKGDSCHDVASWHAALVLKELAPLLMT